MSVTLIYNVNYIYLLARDFDFLQKKNKILKLEASHDSFYKNN